MDKIEMTKDEAVFIGEALALFRNLTNEQQQEIMIDFDKLLAENQS